MTHLRRRILAATLPFLLVAPYAVAQQPSAPSRAEAAAALTAAPAPARYSRQQLDQILAPIALYPDKLLTAVLMAATFPDQLVDAGKWLADPNNAALKDDALAAALEPLPWDPSVKSLVPFPQVIAMLNDHFDWTQSLGVAFNNQQVETMARVQALRERAVTQGKLRSTPQLAVNGGSDGIVIEPVDPAMIYVPVYNPATVYGVWPDRDYPPVFIPPPPEYRDRPIGPGFGIAVGFGVVGALWGWNHPDWRHHDVIVDHDRYTRITNTTQITRNNIVIENNTWRRTAPVAIVPEAARPHRERAATATPVPAGTVAPAAVVVRHPLPAATATPAATTAAPATTTATPPAKTTTAPAATPTAPTGPAHTGTPTPAPGTSATAPTATPSTKEKATTTPPTGSATTAPAGTTGAKEKEKEKEKEKATGAGEPPAHTGAPSTATPTPGHPAATVTPPHPAATTTTPPPPHPAATVTPPPHPAATTTTPTTTATTPPHHEPPPHPVTTTTAPTPPHPAATVAPPPHPAATTTPPPPHPAATTPPKKTPPKPGEEDKSKEH